MSGNFATPTDKPQLWYQKITLGLTHAHTIVGGGGVPLRD